jgi:nucleotide-binding universal stress UspA family protein
MKKVVICVSMQDERETLELQKIKESDILDGREVHFLTVFKVGRHINELSPFNFPSDQQFDDIESAIIDVQKGIAEKILGEKELQQSKQVCYFDANPKLKVRDYLKDENADLVVTSVRKHGIEGLFVSSFTDYMTQHAPCNVFVVKHD